ncbi:MAG: hypothetical protein FWC78_02725 [Defluviitaleaceae bacterium]|nr:hypothetical protein [Defluviitaleaceae bacterium]
MKNKKWSGVKEGIIMYLAISKIMYWANIASDMAQNDFEGAWPLIVDRILLQDLPLVLVIACIVVIDRSRANSYLKFALGYLAYLGIIFVYLLVLFGVFEDGFMAGVLFFRDSFLSFTIMFVVITVVLSVKERFTSKLKEQPEEE